MPLQRYRSRSTTPGRTPQGRSCSLPPTYSALDPFARALAAIVRPARPVTARPVVARPSLRLPLRALAAELARSGAAARAACRVRHRVRLRQSEQSGTDTAAPRCTHGQQMDRTRQQRSSATRCGLARQLKCCCRHPLSLTVTACCALLCVAVRLRARVSRQSSAAAGPAAVPSGGIAKVLVVGNVATGTTCAGIAPLLREHTPVRPPACPHPVYPLCAPPLCAVRQDFGHQPLRSQQVQQGLPDDDRSGLRAEESEGGRSRTQRAAVGHRGTGEIRGTEQSHTHTAAAAPASQPQQPSSHQSRASCCATLSRRCNQQVLILPLCSALRVCMTDLLHSRGGRHHRVRHHSAVSPATHTQATRRRSDCYAR